MARKKKSHAELAEQSARSKEKKNKKAAAAKDENGQTDEKKEKQGSIPVRVITSISFLAAFILLLVMFFMPDAGKLTSLIVQAICGLIGKVGFAVAIPTLLFLFCIHAFSGKRPVMMRTICLSVFVFLCGCIAHLAATGGSNEGIDFLKLYYGGATGETGGLTLSSLWRLF